MNSWVTTCARGGESKRNGGPRTAKVKVKYRQLKAVLDFEKAEGSPTIIHENDGAFPKIPVYYDASKNIAAKVEAEIGNFEEAYNKSPKNLRTSFMSPMLHTCAIEPMRRFLSRLSWPACHHKQHAGTIPREENCFRRR